MSTLDLEHAFYTGDYETVIATDTSSFNEEEGDRAKQLKARAQIATGEAATVAASLKSQASGSPVTNALAVYASHVAGDASATASASKILTSPESNAAAIHLGAMVLVREQEFTEALEALSGVKGHSLDVMLLQVYILLTLNRSDEAKKVVVSARAWANDHIAFNLAEAWTALRDHKDPEAAQKAFYIFEENNSFHATPRSSLGEAVAQLELRRFPEAAESVKIATEGGSDDAKATEAALKAIQNGGAVTYVSEDIKAKTDLFDRVAAKYASTA